MTEETNPNDNDRMTRMAVSKATRDLVKNQKRGGETYDELLQKMVDQYDPDAWDVPFTGFCTACGALHGIEEEEFKDAGCMCGDEVVPVSAIRNPAPYYEEYFSRISDELRVVFEEISDEEEPPDLRFVEVENVAGESIKAGEWVERDDGLTELRIRLREEP